MALTPLNALTVFVTVARRRSFTQAAKELGVSSSAVSQAVRQLEEKLGQALLARTTRSVSLTEAGQRLLDEAGPGLQSALAALEHLAAGETPEMTGSLNLSVPAFSVPIAVEPVLPRFVAAHSHVRIHVSVQDGFVDIVKEGYDAGIRLSEAVQRDMVQVRLTPAFRFLVVGAPAYFERHGAPRHPRDLGSHTCLGYRAPSTGLPYHWEFEQGTKELTVPVKGPLTSDSASLLMNMAREGLGLTYVAEIQAAAALRSGALRPVLEDWAPLVPGLFLYYPHRARASRPLRAFIELARELLPRR
ncbi:LysR family transcriptional regulator [Corallococcus exiguus]|uniref:LysR family transcriptional regulator n=1 Tax=Corallococcus exiguus TaxID=83462 RepID=A0A7X4YGK3_9BACT|nr:LysR family transcriptional regulator [Corallococcus exiguus]NBC44875.1 LysR family transcriptional regulator [Corallococcus exiguus]TNV66034.1 LysR family transcriptional regulator [Corallococcus exiguus]